MKKPCAISPRQKKKQTAFCYKKSRNKERKESRVKTSNSTVFQLTSVILVELILACEKRSLPISENNSQQASPHFKTKTKLS